MEVGERMIRWSVAIIVALLGGLARQARDYQEGIKFSWAGFLSRLIIAGFSGVLVVLLCGEYGLSREMTGVIAGVAGYSGVEAIEAFRRFVRGRYST